MDDKIQVDKSIYEFESYMSKARWSSVWHQLDEVIKLKPESVLEIGPGTGIFKHTASLFGVKVETLDFDPELAPDHVGSATALPFADNTYDVVCAYQMLEHLPYEKTLQAFLEMVRVSRRYVVISLPDSKIVWRYQFHIPKIGTFDKLIRRPSLRAQIHQFDGEHHWEISKKGYSLARITRDFSECALLLKTYRVHENPYHRFFVFNVNEVAKE
jgi:SAM-dependent methyltransferase